MNFGKPVTFSIGDSTFVLVKKVRDNFNLLWNLLMKFDKRTSLSFNEVADSITELEQETDDLEERILMMGGL